MKPQIKFLGLGILFMTLFFTISCSLSDDGVDSGVTETQNLTGLSIPVILQGMVEIPPSAASRALLRGKLEPQNLVIKCQGRNAPIGRDGSFKIHLDFATLYELDVTLPESNSPLLKAIIPETASSNLQINTLTTAFALVFQEFKKKPGLENLDINTLEEFFPINSEEVGALSQLIVEGLKSNFRIVSSDFKLTEMPGIDALTGTAIKKADSKTPKFVTICHVPPGNPGNRKTLTVSENALQAHLNHGDSEGACIVEVITPTTPPTETPTPTTPPAPEPSTNNTTTSTSTTSTTSSTSTGGTNTPPQPPIDKTGPNLLSTNPASGSLKVGVNNSISFTFDEVIKTESFNSTTLTFSPNIPGSHTFNADQKVAIFTPDSNLNFSTTYLVSLSEGLKDLSGNGLVNPKSFSFMTDNQPDNSKPELVSKTPSNLQVNVNKNSKIETQFNEEIAINSVDSSSFSISPQITGTFSFSGTRVIFTPSTSLNSGSYTFTLSDGIKDLAGNSLSSAPLVSSFNVDAGNPTVTANSPTGVSNPITTNTVTVSFNENIDPNSVGPSDFTVNNGVSGNLSVVGNTITLSVTSGNLIKKTTYQAAASTRVKDLAGNPLLATHTWTFKTAGDAGKDWEAVITNSPWTKRAGLTCTVFANQIWLIGGFGGGLKTDIWKTADGANWNLVANSTSLEGRNTHSTIVFNDGSGNKLFVFGGMSSGGRKNDVWKSSDGVNWTQVNPNSPWSPRNYHTITLFNDGSGEKLWLIGGAKDSGNPAPNEFVSTAEIWKSSDAINWTQVTSNANFGARHSHQTVVYDDGTGLKLFVIAGADKLFNGQFFRKNDVWKSSDGLNWTLLTTNAGFSTRVHHECLVYQNKIWLIGGFANPDENDVWTSSNGVSWVQETADAQFSNRETFAVVVFNDGKGESLWTIAGFDGTVNPQVNLNDVWRSP